MIDKLQEERTYLRAVNDVLKKLQDIDEKEELKDKYPLALLLKVIDIPRSSSYYHRLPLQKTDPESELN